MTTLQIIGWFMLGGIAGIAALLLFGISYVLRNPPGG